MKTIKILLLVLLFASCSSESLDIVGCGCEEITTVALKPSSLLTDSDWREVTNKEFTSSCESGVLSSRKFYKDGSQLVETIEVVCNF